MFFVNALMCHGELARTRPSTRYLTAFYLWIATGGVNPSRLITFRFTILDKTALQRLRFDLEEVHEVSATNLLSLVRSPSPGQIP